MPNPIIADFKRRKDIYEFLSQNSGLHMRDISRKMNIPYTSLKYHLNYLQKNGFIIIKKDGKYNRYYISKTVGESEKKILNCFRKNITLYIVLYFFVAVQCTQKDLSRYLGKHPATINFHLRKMVHAGIIKQIPINEGVIYTETLPSNIKRPQISSEKIYVLTDHWMIYNLLKKFKEQLDDKTLIAGIIEFIEFYTTDGIPKQIQNREDTMKSLVNTLFGLFFPPSFCS